MLTRIIVKTNQAVKEIPDNLHNGQKRSIGNKEKQRYIDKSICLLATRFTYYPVRIIKPFYYIYIFLSCKHISFTYH